MSLLSNMFDAMNGWGFYDFLFPWLLIMAVMYGILQTKQIISSEVSVNGVISVVFSFLVAYMIKGEYLINFVGTFAIFLLILLVGLIFAGLGGVNVSDLNAKWLSYTFLGVGILAGIVAFFNSKGTDYFNLSFSFINSDILGMVVVLAIMVGAIYFIVKSN